MFGGADIVSQKHTIRIFSPNRKQASSDAQDAALAPAAPLCAPTQVGHDRTYYNRMVAEEMRKEWDAARCLVIDANEKVKSESKTIQINRNPIIFWTIMMLTTLNIFEIITWTSV